MDWIHLLQDILVIILQLQVAGTVLSLLKQKRKKEKRRRVCFICAGVEPQAYRQSLGRNSHPCSASQAPSSLSQLCPDYLNTPGSCISQISSTTFLEPF